MRKDGAQGTWTFGLLWIIANTFSWGVYFIFAMASGWFVWQAYQNLSIGLAFRFLANESIRLLIAAVICGFCWGGIIGVLQQLVLGRRFKLEGKRWVFATIIIGIMLYMTFQGLDWFLVQLFMRFTFSYSVIEILNRIAYSFIPPLALGIAQWFILRQYFTKSGWWIVATVIASGFSTLVTSIFAGGGGRSFLLSSIVSSSVVGLIYGLVTLIALTIISSNQVRTVEKE